MFENTTIGDYMPFTGFTPEALDYFFSIELDNTRENYERLRGQYLRAVKEPLHKLYDGLTPLVRLIDPDICHRRARCIPTAFADTRIARVPMRTRTYLHYCAELPSEENVPGFYFEFDARGYRSGLRIYHYTTAGMHALRGAAAENLDEFRRVLTPLEGSGLNFAGEMYKKPRYPDAPEPAQKWLNAKTWRIERAVSPPDELFFSPALLQRLADDFSALAGLYHFLRTLSMTTHTPILY
jgi:uncharacterized protein (DUF2461 family)